MKAFLKGISVVALGSALLIPDVALAQYEGPGSGEHAAKELPPVEQLRWEGDSVESVKEFAATYEKLHRPIVLRGHIVEQVGPDRYRFEDTSGSIRIDADPGRFPSPPINENTTVDIIGNVDQRYVNEVEIDVSHIRVVSR